MTEFYFIRHGQTTANAKGLKQGIINSEITNLSTIGQQQVQNLYQHFDIQFADQLIASPLQRTKDTAKILNQTAHLPITIDKRLLEISYGKWDGKPNKSLQAKYPEVFDDVINDVLPTYAPLANGETFDHVINRVDNLMKFYGEKFPNDKLILVTHGFTIKSAAMATLSTNVDPMVITEPDNASVTHITLKKQRYYLSKYNQTF